MIKLLKCFFSYVPREPPPEVPKEEPPDPNENRALSNAYRAARRSMLVVCGLCLGWSSAQFTIADPRINAVGISVDFKDASIPLVLAAVLIYLAIRWGIEFAMMPRHVRRWPLAQLDFRIVLAIARLALLALAAGALDRSLLTIILVIVSVGLLAVISIAFSIILINVTAPIRMWARSRAGRDSVAHAAVEGMVWAGLFAVCITVLGVCGLGIASYCYAPLRDAIWEVPPNPVALSMFVLTLIGVFLSYFLLVPVTSRMFAEPPTYYTERDSNGNLLVHNVVKEREPLL